MTTTRFVVQNLISLQYLYKVVIPPSSTEAGCVWGPDIDQAMDCGREDMAMVICDIWNITVPGMCVPIEVSSKVQKDVVPRLRVVDRNAN